MSHSQVIRNVPWCIAYIVVVKEIELSESNQDMNKPGHTCIYRRFENRRRCGTTFQSRVSKIDFRIFVVFTLWNKCRYMLYALGVAVRIAWCWWISGWTDQSHPGQY